MNLSMKLAFILVFVRAAVSGSKSGLLTVRIPAALEDQNLVVCANSQTEVAAWSPPNHTSPGPQYTHRVHISVTEAREGKTVTIDIFNATEDDTRSFYQCHSASCVGTPVNCSATYHSQEVSSLKQNCSYSSTDRTVRCDEVTSEVRIYRSGKQSDRDIRYFSSPFQFQLGEREAGTYRVALVSGDNGLHSDLFEFHVDKHTRVADGEFDLHVILGLAIPLAVFLVLPLAGIDIIVRVWKEQHQPQKSETSENVPLTSMSSQHRDQEQQWTNMNGQHSVPTEPFSEDSDAQA